MAFFRKTNGFESLRRYLNRRRGRRSGYLFGRRRRSHGLRGMLRRALG